MSADPATQRWHDPGDSRGDGVSEFPYLTWEGGPHLLLPCSCADEWGGSPPDADPYTLSGDYGRACAATDGVEFGVVQVGTDTALVFSTDAFTSWGVSKSGEFEIYVFWEWADLSPDDLLDLAREKAVVSDFDDLDLTFRLRSSGAYLMWSGDTVEDPITSVYLVPIPAGEYQVAAHSFQTAGDWVDIYRLIPLEKYEVMKDELGGWVAHKHPAQ